MKQKFLLTFICLVCGFSLTAQTIQWGYVGNIKTEERGKNGYLYKASTNDILHHQAQHKINALYLNFYERKKDKKKEKSRYCLIEFQAAMSPRTDDYARFPHDADAPFWNLAFGFHEDVKTPDNYGGMDVLVTGALYRNDWTVRHKEGVEHISQKKSGNTFSMPNDYISYRGISCRFAPVKIQILLDSIEKKIWFYLNGVLQNEVPFIHKQPYYIPGTFVLFWEKHKNNRDRRIFELSPATVEHLNEKPEITPAPIKGIYYSGVLSDTEYETAWQLLFGEKNDWKKGFSSMKHLADREHAAAAFDLACCYAWGIGCQPDLKLALEYAEKAAEMDIPEAASLYLELAKEKYLPGDMLSNKSYSLA